MLLPNRVHFRCRLSGSFRCSPPRLTATQLLQVLIRNTVPDGRGLSPRRIVTLHSALRAAFGLGAFQGSFQSAAAADAFEHLVVHVSTCRPVERAISTDADHPSSKVRFVQRRFLRRGIFKLRASGPFARALKDGYFRKGGGWLGWQVELGGRILRTRTTRPYQRWSCGLGLCMKRLRRA